MREEESHPSALPAPMISKSPLGTSDPTSHPQPNEAPTTSHRPPPRMGQCRGLTTHRTSELFAFVFPHQGSRCHLPRLQPA